MTYGTKELREWPPLCRIINSEYHPSTAFCHFAGPYMRSVPMVWINIVLASESCNFPEVAVVVEHFSPFSNFLDTSTHGIEMASLYLLCTQDLYTCSVMRPLMRPLLSYSGFWWNMKSYHLESVNDICSPSPSWSQHFSHSVLWKRCATQRGNQHLEKRMFLSWPARRQVEFSNTLTPI